MLKILTEKLPKELVGTDANLNLLAQAVHVQRERSHVGLRNTKTRSEINRTTKKVYKQKGTGGARHGSRRANVFVGGGVTFGPRPERRILTLPLALKIKAKSMAFSVKAKLKELQVVEGLDKLTKTKEVAEFLNKLGSKRVTFILGDKNVKANKFISNLENAKAVLYRNVTAFEILEGGMLLVDSSVFEKKEVKKS